MVRAVCTCSWWEKGGGGYVEGGEGVSCSSVSKLLLLVFSLILIYRNNPKYWDRQAFANSVDPDQMPQNAASDQGLVCLSYIQ